MGVKRRARIYVGVWWAGRSIPPALRSGTHSSPPTTPSKGAQYNILSKIGCKVFFDVDSLTIICKEDLETNVVDSRIFLLFLDDVVLDSEWCAFEIMVAVRFRVPIHVVVDIDHHKIEDLITLWRDVKKKPVAKEPFFILGWFEACFLGPLGGPACQSPQTSPDLCGRARAHPPFLSACGLPI